MKLTTYTSDLPWGKVPAAQSVASLPPSEATAAATVAVQTSNANETQTIATSNMLAPPEASPMVEEDRQSSKPWLMWAQRVNQFLASIPRIGFVPVDKAGDTGIGILGMAGAKIGVLPNYTEFEPDGTAVKHGDATVWNDIVFPIIPKFTGAGNPSFTTFTGGITAPQFAVNDSVQLDASEFAHEWLQGSQCDIHLHFTTASNDGTARYVKWEVGYTYTADTNGTTQWTAETVLQVEIIIPANTPALTEWILPMGNFTPTNGKIGGQVRMRLKRITASGGSAPSLNVFVTQVGIHIQCDTDGSRQVYIK